MTFREAMVKTYKRVRNKSKLNNPFFVYSCVSDLIGNSYEDKKRAKLFFQLNSVINLFELAQEDENSESKVSCRYNEVEDLMTAESYRQIVYIVYAIVYPNTHKLVNTPAKKQTHKVQSVANAVQQKVSATTPNVATATTKPKVNTTKPKTTANETATVTTTNVTANSAPPQQREVAKILIPIAIVVVIVLLIIFGKYIPWSVWQYPIGIGAIVVVAVVANIVAVIVEDIGCDSCLALLVVYSLVIVLNFIFKCVWADNYETIYNIVSSGVVGLCVFTWKEESGLLENYQGIWFGVIIAVSVICLFI